MSDPNAESPDHSDLEARPTMSAAPPVVPGPMAAKQSTWPTVVGIIAIILGALGFMQYGCNSVGAPLGRYLVDRFVVQSGAMPPEQIEAAFAYYGWNIAINSYGFVLAIFLLAAAIGLTRRRAWTRRGLMLWAPLKLLHAVGLAALTFLTVQAQGSANAQMQGAPPWMGQLMSGVGAATAVVTFLVLMALPAFLLFWFSRGRVRDEVAEWK